MPLTTWTVQESSDHALELTLSVGRLKPRW